MKDLKITIVQTKLHWENIFGNIAMFNDHVGSIKKNSTDLVVLPEMFTSGFTMNAVMKHDEMNGYTMGWMKNLSRKVNAVICGSIIIKEKRKYYNRLIWMNPDGGFKTYDKRHLFRMAKENETYTEGKEKLIVELKGWKICPLVCYDLRFPVWSRNDSKKRYDVLLYVANWPKQRSYPWKQLLIARAIENQAYVAGVNRIGKDGKGIEYSGDSVVLNSSGEKISKTKPGKTSVETITLSWKKLEEHRKSFPVFMDADDFKIKP